MPQSIRTFALAGLLLAGAAGCAPPPCCAPAAGEALVQDAREFMAGYARDLLAGDRNAIVGRYDPRGAYFVGQGRKELVPMDSIRASYLGGWQPPASFEWQDLSYEVAGPDAVVVTGKFAWGGGSGRTATFSYTGLLLRRDGRLRIRLEDESGAPPRPAPAPTP
jgi:hypothetical protein